MHTFIVIAAFCALTLSMADQAWATNGHQFIGVGAYEKSMGGAVTAAPGATTAAISNPAGMALLGARADFSFEAFMPKRSENFTALGGESTEGGTDLYLVPAVGWVGPVGGRDDLFFGGGMFVTSGMGVDYDTIKVGPFGAVLGQLQGVTDPSMLDMSPWYANVYTQNQFWKLAPALAKRVNDRLAVGVSLNIDYQQIALKQRFFEPNSGQVMGFDLTRASGALGFGVTLGVIYKVNDLIQLGATYISEQFFGDMEYRLSQGDIITAPDAMGNSLVNRNGSYNWGLNFPQQVAVGVAITPNQKLKVTADVKWINFSSEYDEPTLDGTFDVVNLQTGPTGQTAGSVPLPFGWDDVLVLAVGVEYKVNPMVTLRAGFNHGDSPIKTEDVWNNMAFPAVTEDHLGLGVDLTLGDHWGVGLAFMRAFNNSLSGKKDLTVLGQTIDSNAELELEETSVLLSVSYVFAR